MNAEKLEHLKWEARGCCGEHEVASYEDAAGRCVTIDRSGEKLVVSLIASGLCVEPPSLHESLGSASDWLRERNAMPI